MRRNTVTADRDNAGESGVTVIGGRGRAVAGVRGAVDACSANQVKAATIGGRAVAICRDPCHMHAIPIGACALAIHRHLGVEPGAVGAAALAILRQTNVDTGAGSKGVAGAIQSLICLQCGKGTDANSGRVFHLSAVNRGAPAFAYRAITHMPGDNAVASNRSHRARFNNGRIAGAKIDSFAQDARDRDPGDQDVGYESIKINSIHETGAAESITIQDHAALNETIPDRDVVRAGDENGGAVRAAGR